MNIKLNNEIEIDLTKLVAGKLLAQAGSGGGKSYLIRRLLEQSFGKIQHIVLDTEGEFSSLREKYDYILIGKGYDIAADPKTAALMALRLWEEGVNAIIDLYELDPEDRQKFVDNFVGAMINAPKKLWKPVMLVIDEAHEYAPENEQSKYGIAMQRLASKGRKRRILAVFATQSIAQLSKRIVASCKNKLIGYASETNDVKRAAFELGMTPQEGLALRDLDPGEFYAFGPAISKKVIKLKVGPVKTKHEESAGATSKPAPASAKIKKALARLADLPAEVAEEANTMDSLKKENAKMKALLREKPKADPDAIKKIADKAFDLGVETMKTKMAEREKVWMGYMREMQGMFNALAKNFDATANWIKRLGELVEMMPDKIEAPKFIQVKPDTFKNVKYEVKVNVQPQRETQNNYMTDEYENTSAVGKGERTVLIAAVQYRNLGIDRAGVTTVTGYQRSSRDSYIARLLKRGYVMFSGDKLYPTQEGSDFLGDDYQPLPTGQELRNHLMQTLPAGEKAVLSALIGQRIDGNDGYIARDWVTQETNYQRSSRDSYIARLANRQLVEVTSGGVRAVDRLFEDL